MTLFALLHGGMHHGSSWRLVAGELMRCGHRVVAPDLPVDDATAGAEAWAGVVLDAIEDAGGPGEDVVVVGHSIAGLCLPVVASFCPVRSLVFVGGLIPVPGQSFVEHLAENPEAITFPAPADSGSGTGPFGLTWETVREGFYHDCPEPLARDAFECLRGQAFTVFTEPCPLDRWPEVPSTYVLMRDDRAVGQAWARRGANRIGADIVELGGGHSPFFSRPGALSDALMGVRE